MSYFRREYRYITYTQQLVCMRQQVAFTRSKEKIYKPSSSFSLLTEDFIWYISSSSSALNIYLAFE